MTENKHVDILHFSDMLCVWAYLAQIRMDELREQLGNKVRIHYHFTPVYGAVASKLESGWGHRGGAAAYAAHVHEVLSGFEHVSAHPDIWTQNVPTTSSAAHELVKAVQLLEKKSELSTSGDSPLLSETLAWQLRLAFFTELIDISDRSRLLEVTEKAGIPIAPVEALLNSGAALASLEEDVQLRTQHQVTGSPTLVFNEGRQRLYGNVGYRVIEANIQELLADSGDRASWC